MCDNCRPTPELQTVPIIAISMNTALSKQTAALDWIVTLLRERNIASCFCGGLAVLGYGGSRPLNDIDLFVPSDRFAEVFLAGKNYVSKPAQHYCEMSEGWDLEYGQFKYGEIKIEVGSSHNASIYDSTANVWVPLELDFSKCQYLNVFGIKIPLMEREQLIAYKKMLDRPVDREDVEQLLKSI